MAKPLIVGNWKSYITSFKEGEELFSGIVKKLPKVSKAEVVVCPPAPMLDFLSDGYRGSRVAFGVQDIFYEDGAHTGEISAKLAKDAGALFTIVGHAERRALGDTDETVSKKVSTALDVKLTPIVAIGESERDKDGNYLKTLEESIFGSLERLGSVPLRRIVLAYEPVWAIGAPLPPNARTIRETIIFIRKTLASRFGRDDALKVRILYGGAVNVESADELIKEGDADGFLLGRASTDAETFTAIIRKWG